MDVASLAPFTNVQCPECGEHNRVKVDVGGYILKKRQGVGGMSLVFGAVDKTLGREVAIKILNEDYSMDAKRIEQFELEARITAAMSHPHIVKVYTVGQAFNRFYIAMELVAGDSLEQKMNDEGKLSESDVLHWAKQVADGLNAANESGLIHRDIKPGNILFDKDGHVKIVDFGLALVTQGGKAQADEIWATPYYVPPEALDVLEEDFRSDIYALGASLFHALAGQPSFTTESRSTSELKQIKRDLPSLKSVAPWLSDETCYVIDKAMSFEMDDRYGSYQELIDALQYAETILNHEGENPPMSSEELEKLEKKKKRHGWMIPAIAGVAVLLVGALVFTFLQNDDEPVVVKPVEVAAPEGGGATVSSDVSKRVGQQIALSRGSLKNKNYAAAAQKYGAIAADSKVPKDTVYWAGLQTATIHWLAGNSGSARKQLRQLAVLSRQEGGSGSEIGRRLELAVDSLVDFGKVDPEQYASLDNELDAMIAFASGLKNWSRGYVAEALVLFEKVEAFETDEPSTEYKFYKSRVADYQHDAEVVQSLRGEFYPKTVEELNQRIEQLEGIESKLKTIQVEAAAIEAAAKAREAAKAAEAVAEVKNKPAVKVSWNKVQDEISEDIRACRFKKVERVIEKKKYLTAKDKKKAEAYSRMCEYADGFKVTIKNSLTNRQTDTEVGLRDGSGVFTSIYDVTQRGLTVRDSGKDRVLTWAEVKPGDLVDLHKFNVSSKLSDFEKNYRLEQAVCFAWLMGEATKAESGSRVLGRSSKEFKKRWDTAMELLAN